MAGKAGVHTAGHDVADPDVVVPVIEHHGFAKAVKPELRGIVGRAAGERISSGEAADVDDPAALAAVKSFDRLAAAIEGAGEIGGDDAIPIFDGELARGSKRSDSGVINEIVEAAQFFVGEGEQRCYVLAFADVGGEPGCSTARDGCEFLEGFLKRLLAAPGDEDVRSFSEEGFCDGETDSSGAASDDCFFAFDGLIGDGLIHNGLMFLYFIVVQRHVGTRLAAERCRRRTPDDTSSLASHELNGLAKRWMSRSRTGPQGGILTYMAAQPDALLTVEDYAKLPDLIGFRDELIEGERVLSPMPKKAHTLVLENLEEILKPQVQNARVVRESGWFFRSAEGLDSVPGPGLMILSEQDYESPSASGWFEGKPLFVTDVISPSERKSRRLQKAALYLEVGAGAAVEVDLTKRVVLVHTLEADAAEVISTGSIEWPFRAELSAIFARLT